MSQSTSTDQREALPSTSVHQNSRPLLIFGGALVIFLALGAALIWQLQTSGTTVVRGTDPGETATGFASEPLREDSVQAVTSSHALATQAGQEILDAGGTAADAAVAVAAVLSVVEPWFSSSLGGGTWALYYNADSGEVTSVDGVGPTGSNATRSNYAPRAGEPGIHQAIVPGAWSGWITWMREYGTMDLDEVLQSAITIAREGYEVSENLAGWLNSQAEVTRARASAAAIYAPDGELVQAGDTVYQHDMADTFQALADAYREALPEGRVAALQAAHDYFYLGPIAETLVAYSDANGGYLTMSDFARMDAQLHEPLRIQYNDQITVLQNPPNSHGITMLLALNYLRDFDFSNLTADDPDAIHRQAEAVKLAFADRHYHIGDPARIDIPIEGLLSDEHIARQIARIDMQQAMEWPIQDGYEPLPDDLANTTTFHVFDQYGNGAAVTTSLGAQFYPVADTGIHINHRMRFLSLEADNANVVSPGYKVRHTSNPYMAFRNGELYILGGNTGADTQPQAQVQQFLNVVEFGMTAQESVARPRFVSTAWPSTVYSHQVRNTLQLEDIDGGFPQVTIDELEARGHNVVIGDGVWGDGNMIVITDGGVDADVGTDPRVDVALGEKKLYKEDGREEVESTP